MPSTRSQLNFVGDVMLGRLIDQLLPNHVRCPEDARHVAHFVAINPELRDYGFKSPWGNTIPLFHSANLNLINLETSVTNHHRPWPNKVFNYRMHPMNIQCLKEAGIHYTSLANNHTLDYSEEGLLETVRTLKDAGIAFAGAGETRDEACRPAILKLQGEDNETYSVHVYSVSDHPSDWSTVLNFHLIDYSSKTRNHLKSLLTSSASQPDLKIFSVHWGPNYSWTPSNNIRSLAHFLIDECGVDIIHGHSSHHIQGVEVYKEKLIIYGYRNNISAIWRVTVEKSEEEDRGKLVVKKLQVFPSCIKRFQVNLLEQHDTDHRWALGKFRELTGAFGTKVEKAVGQDGQIVVDLTSQ
ncbi:polyglutamate biosynthesis protein [Lindgomyces ingoldianus]|uniref:Polyglutamate biosynthesis protein n=1 Tax=Lindgomyces ingoldianus TaxID=673940 RepID=A0ACB6Q9Z9_9PLEO|nr:polyglutamate biosynthesis protein [Lindgomyces ingoldianus]KAF2462965.1 polyglutamate biosynthesis protein [Lindgomyces ingoldianus]